eukprot:UN24883
MKIQYITRQNLKCWMFDLAGFDGIKGLRMLSKVFQAEFLCGLLKNIEKSLRNEISIRGKLYWQKTFDLEEVYLKFFGLKISPKKKKDKKDVREWKFDFKDFEVQKLGYLAGLLTQTVLPDVFLKSVGKIKYF